MSIRPTLVTRSQSLTLRFRSTTSARDSREIEETIDAVTTSPPTLRMVLLREVEVTAVEEEAEEAVAEATEVETVLRAKEDVKVVRPPVLLEKVTMSDKIDPRDKTEIEDPEVVIETRKASKPLLTVTTETVDLETTSTEMRDLRVREDPTTTTDAKVAKDVRVVRTTEEVRDASVNQENQESAESQESLENPESPRSQESQEVRERRDPQEEVEEVLEAEIEVALTDLRVTESREVASEAIEAETEVVTEVAKEVVKEAAETEVPEVATEVATEVEPDLKVKSPPLPPLLLSETLVATAT